MNNCLRIGFLFILLLLLSLIPLGVFADSIPKQLQQPPVTAMAVESRKGLPTLASPYDIARYINQNGSEADLNEIWDRFGIAAAKPGKCGCHGDDCPGSCKSRAINIDLRRGDGNYVILRICYADELECWFLLFKKEANWRCLGVAESNENKYNPVEHRIVNQGNDHWLVIKAGNGGTGALRYDERWFYVSDEGLKEVLSYPVSGYSLQGNSDDYELRSTVRNIRQRSEYSAVVNYRVFKDHSGPRFHWARSTKQSLWFDWNKKAGKFMLNKRKSQFAASAGDPIHRYLEKQGYFKSTL